MSAKREPNYCIYVDGMGFLTETNRPDFFFVNIVDEAKFFTKKDADALCARLCDEYESVWSMKRCSRHMSSKSFSKISH